MQWKIFYFDVNKNKIVVTNIFEGGSNGFRRELKDAAKKFDNVEEFADEVKASLMYHYWSKCEWETLIMPWVGGRDTKPAKVDVYWQIVNAWDAFIEYCWNHREELRND